MRFVVDTSGIPRQQRRIESVSERMGDLRPAGNAVLDELVEAERRHWNSLPSPPLAKSTRDRKHRQGLPPRRMHASGLLERTMTSRGATARGHGQLNRRGKGSILFGIKRGRVDIFYARFHQKGKGVPKRVVVPKPTALTRARVSGIVLEHITREAQ